MNETTPSFSSGFVYTQKAEIIIKIAHVVKYIQYVFYKCGNAIWKILQEI